MLKISLIFILRIVSVMITVAEVVTMATGAGVVSVGDRVGDMDGCKVGSVVGDRVGDKVGAVDVCEVGSVVGDGAAAALIWKSPIPQNTLYPGVLWMNVLMEIVG